MEGGKGGYIGWIRSSGGREGGCIGNIGPAGEILGGEDREAV